MQNWETLIAGRRRPCATMPSVTDTHKLCKKMTSAARYQRIKNDPVLREKRRKQQKKNRSTDKYRKYHSDYMRQWRKAHPLTERQRELNRERNRRYKQRKRAEAKQEFNN